MEYAFPGIVVLLKLTFRNLVGRGFSVLEFGKSLLLFPVDISFLGLSFAAISLSNKQVVSREILDVREASFVFISCVIGLMIQQALSRAAEENLDNARYIAMGVLAFLAYVLSAFILLGTLNIGGLI